ncbi:MAG: Radical SAM superfamily protein [Syntrophus sp. PtaB.Bin001]|nr:MAG: Radical SAM superfamily protein [Syntrophus sp. PtaB.Bin001]
MSWTRQKRDEQLLSQENGWRKKVWGDNLKVCLVYPNVYRIGMANLGFQTVYRLLNDLPFCLCERAFFSSPGETDVPAEKRPVSLESGRQLKDFDIVAFAVPFENDYPHILSILEQAGISLETRLRDHSEPLVMAGGIAVTLNPEPLSSFIDLFLLGEAEEMLPEFAELYRDALGKGRERRECLLDVQRGVAGAYVPQFYQVSYKCDGTIEDMKPTEASLPRKIQRRWTREISSFTTEQIITTPAAEFSELFLTEVSRGCRRGCRFCAAGFVYRPVRFRQMEVLEPSFDRGIAQGKKIGLLGTAVSDHPQLPELCRSVMEKGGCFALGSLRMDRLTSEMARLLRESGVETVALAPEAGTQRLRDVLHKGISEDHIFHAVESLIREEIRQIRLYFMVGLPTETETDIDGLISLTKRIRHYSLQISQGKRPFKRIILSVNQFIPKPSTPFQWHPLEDIRIIKKKLLHIQKALRREGPVRVFHDLPKWNYIQTLLSLGDRRVGLVLLAVHKLGGNWSQALKSVNLNSDFYVYRQKDLQETFPWDFIDHEIDKSFLLGEYRKSLAEIP